MEENNTQQPELGIELSPEVAQGKYANLVLIGYSGSEFVLDFASVLPGIPKALVNSRLILAPENAKRLLFALNENIQRYEQEFGAIGMPAAEEESKTVAPFGVAKNEA